MLPELGCAEDDVWTMDEGVADADHVFLLLHGMEGKPSRLNDLKDEILRSAEERGEDVRVLAPTLPLGAAGRADLTALCAEIANAFRDTVNAIGATRVTLIGHSTGGPLIQAVYLNLEADRDFTLPADQTRLILLSSLNNGWTMDHSMPPQTKIAYSVGAAFAVVLKFVALVTQWMTRQPARTPWVLQIRRGSPFLIDIQLRWLSLRDRAQPHDDGSSAAALPKVVQVLGSSDELISWSDSISTSTVDSFEFVNMPDTDHLSSIVLNDEAHPERGALRREIFARAIWDDEQRDSIEPWDEIPPPPEDNVERVVFVVHGIRDEGHWTQKIGLRARHVYAQAHPNTNAHRKIAIITSGYGFFSMLQFLNPFERLKKVHWFVHHYVEARRRYPNADFSFIGHSNGTYLFAKSLMLYDRIRFQRIVFAGSVVTQSFPWDRFLKANAATDQAGSGAASPPPQQDQVLNFAANGDWVVAMFPMVGDWGAVRRIFPGLLGGVGVGAFRSDPGHGQIHQREYVRGGHGAAIQEKYWDDLARFVVLGEPPQPDTIDTTPRPKWWVASRLVRRGGLVALGILALILLPLIAFSFPILFWLALLVPLALGIFWLLLPRLILKIDPHEDYPQWGEPGRVMLIALLSTVAFWLYLLAVLAIGSGLDYWIWPAQGADMAQSVGAALNAQVDEAICTACAEEAQADPTLLVLKALSLLGYIWLLNRILSRV